MRANETIIVYVAVKQQHRMFWNNAGGYREYRLLRLNNNIGCFEILR